MQAQFPSWSGRVVRCGALWVGLLVVALTFDVVMEGFDFAADDVPAELDENQSKWPSWDLIAQAIPGVLLLWFVAGALSGSLLPRRIDPRHLQRPIPKSGEHVTTPPSLLGHSVRRSIVAIPYLAGVTTATLGAALSITTNVVQDDSPSTLGAAGGLFYGSVVGWILAVIAGPLLGVGTAQTLDADLPRRRSTLICTAATVAVGFVPMLLLLEYAPSETPGVAHLATVVAFLMGCSAVGDWLVRWKYRPRSMTDDHRPR